MEDKKKHTINYQLLRSLTLNVCRIACINITYFKNKWLLLKILLNFTTKAYKRSDVSKIFNQDAYRKAKAENKIKNYIT